MLRVFLSITITILLFADSAQAAASLFDAASAGSPSTRLQQRLGVRSGAVRYDARMIRAAEIAMARAHTETTWYCWRYVKDALLAARVIEQRPTTAHARQAGEELCRRFGFKKLRTLDPKKAPVGAVIVYGGADAGHVELRTTRGFVSDFRSRTPYPRPVLGIYVKPV